MVYSGTVEGAANDYSSFSFDEAMQLKQVDLEMARAQANGAKIAAIIGGACTVAAAGIAMYSSYKDRQETRKMIEANQQLCQQIGTLGNNLGNIGLPAPVDPTISGVDVVTF